MMEEDKGHEKLVADLRALLTEAENFNFHDFESKEYGSPKMRLSDKFRVLRRDVLAGEYDNK